MGTSFFLKMFKLILYVLQDQKRKLFHTSVYESATQLQKLYVQTCRRLPAYGCRLVVVKELLRGKTKKKVFTEFNIKIFNKLIYKLIYFLTYWFLQIYNCS